MEIQHVNVKIFAAQPAPDDLGPAIPMFHRWIQNAVTDDLLIDVADYRHVPEGPGVMLIGYEAHYGLDRTGGRLGLLYNRRVATRGTPGERLQQAYDAALAAARRIEDEPEFRGKLKFHAGDVEVIFNDRCITPNTAETCDTLKSELERFFDGLWSAGSYTLEHTGEPRDRLRLRAAIHSHNLQPV